MGADCKSVAKASKVRILHLPHHERPLISAHAGQSGAFRVPSLDWWHGATMVHMAMTLRLNDEEQQILNQLAADEHVSGHEVIRRALLERAARRGHEVRVDAAFVEAEQEWSGLLDRLARDA
jgi:predicted transcriptional regulator